MSQKQPIERGYKPTMDGYKPSLEKQSGHKVTGGYKPEKNTINTPPPTPPKKG